MFELTLSIKLEKQKFLLDFKKKLTSELGENFATIISHNDEGRCHLAIACEQGKKEYIKAKVLSGVLEIILSAYKFEYFKDMLFSQSSSLMSMPFLKAISIFDADSDYEIIKREINLSGEILIDSFFHFRLQGLKDRWEKTAIIILKNGIIQSETAMIEVIKYLTSSSENYSLVANVELSQKKLEIKNYSGTKSYLASSDGMSKFLSEIIALNPLKINLRLSYELDENNKICKILNDIFGEKIYMQN